MPKGKKQLEEQFENRYVARLNIKRVPFSGQESIE